VSAIDNPDALVTTDVLVASKWRFHLTDRSDFCRRLAERGKA
jgi:hypothetical protein